MQVHICIVMKKHQNSWGAYWTVGSTMLTWDLLHPFNHELLLWHLFCTNSFSCAFQYNYTPPLISPALALLYSPFTSLCSQTSRGASTNTSKKGSPAASWIFLAFRRSWWREKKKKKKKKRTRSHKSETCTRFDLLGKYIQPRHRLCRLCILSWGVAHPAVGRNEAGDAHQPGVSKQPRHLSNAPDVLFAVLWAEAQVFVQPLTDVVPIQGVAGDAVTDQVLL